MKVLLEQNVNDPHAKTLSSLLRQIGEHLTALRKKKGFRNHEDFARSFDLPRVHYWRLEKGKSNFTLKTLKKVLAIHGLTIQDFFRGNIRH